MNSASMLLPSSSMKATARSFSSTASHSGAAGRKPAHLVLDRRPVFGRQEVMRGIDGVAPDFDGARAIGGGGGAGCVSCPRL